MSEPFNCPYQAALTAATEENVRLKERVGELEAALHEAQWTVTFLHGCLISPQCHKYAYPEQTEQRLEEWEKLAPLPPTCMHSWHHEECLSCRQRAALNPERTDR